MSPFSYPAIHVSGKDGPVVLSHFPLRTHICHFFKTPAELAEILVPFFKEGLEKGEFCLWGAAAPLPVAEAAASLRAAVPDLDDYVRRGQIHIFDVDELYKQGGAFDPTKALADLTALIRQAFENGYKGFRCDGNTGGVPREERHNFEFYETAVTGIAERFSVTALCSYPLEGVELPALIGAVSTHRSALIKNGDTWFLIESSEQKLLEQARRERAEKDLTLSRQELRTITDVAPAIIWVAHDPHCRRVTGNPASYKLLRLPPGGNISRSGPDGERPTNFRVFRKGRELADSELPLQRAAATGADVLDAELDLVFNDGSVRHLFGGARPLFDNQENVRGAVATFVDITDRRKAEEQIRLLNNELERRVLDRTAKLAEANRELEAFCHSVSHDLRAPLRTILGFADALSEDYAAGLDGGGKEFLSRIQAASRRMAGLMDDLLNLSRVARKELRQENMDLSAEAEAIVQELRKAEPARAIDVSVQPGLAARGDAALLRVVLQNLIENAWKFTRHRAGAKIEIGARPDGGAKKTVYFIKDNGAGFDMEYADKLFQAFQRLHTEQEFSGSGIGLVSVRRIIERHGGRVWAEGKRDEGATFSFTL